MARRMTGPPPRIVRQIAVPLVLLESAHDGPNGDETKLAASACLRGASTRSSSGTRRIRRPRLMDVRDFPEMIADRYHVHNIEVVLPHFLGAEPVDGPRFQEPPREGAFTAGPYAARLRRAVEQAGHLVDRSNGAGRRARRCTRKASTPPPRSAARRALRSRQGQPRRSVADDRLVQAAQGLRRRQGDRGRRREPRRRLRRIPKCW